MTEIGMIWGQTPDGVIGASGDIPWYVPEDFLHFKKNTLGNPVIMGRATWDSLPEKNRPLPGRVNIVVTRNPEWATSGTADGATVAYSLTEAVALAADAARADKPAHDAAHDAVQDADAAQTIWIIGGQQLFQEGAAIAHRIERSIIDATVAGDTFAPTLGPDWKLEEADRSWLTSKNGTRYRHERLHRG